MVAKSEIKNKTSQDDLLSRRLNAKSLFDDDLETLTDMETQCLRYIVAHSPADTIDIIANNMLVPRIPSWEGQGVGDSVRSNMAILNPPLPLPGGEFGGFAVPRKIIRDNV